MNVLNIYRSLALRRGSMATNDRALRQAGVILVVPPGAMPVINTEYNLKQNAD